ncbi:NTP transferase domain-containing protein [Pseudidiomarina taiwanensis]|uniref:Uncharacterized protein n=1 Tax=Pseudidiomarina taiwanensis TaxID=337250 RepID=A0A432ZK38_9GAMM|nr:NTP transferase domain-containing protein [Pseudidiomarina taiwanensis]RUO78387.1 hypothetical protein CWI83_04985 [Pseudidiomarina taiwanensis]
MAVVSQILILAAGNSQRFRATAPTAIVQQFQHKALVPIWDSRGSLMLLLDHLVELGVEPNHIYIATGCAAPLLSATVTHRHPQLKCLAPHTDFTKRSMMQTLQHSFRQLPQRPTWVLFADTLYSREFLDKTVAQPLTRSTIACTKLRDDEQTPTEVTVTVAANKVHAFDSTEVPTHTMAHAVFWPAPQTIHELMSAPSQQKQWQVLARQQEPVEVIEVPEFAATDIDTYADLLALRPQVNEQVLDYFEHNLNKDKRSDANADQMDGSYYFKQCESEQAARHEAAVLRLLQKHLPNYTPALVRCKGRELVVEAVRGIRLYDLLRQLQQPKYSEIKACLMQRCNERLQAIQAVLEQHKNTLTQEPYPFQQQVGQLLGSICQLLDIKAPATQELAKLEQQWNQLCCIPFRDATPKNIILADPELCSTLNHQERQNNLQQRLDGSITYWQQLPIMDIDFTSTKHLSSRDDDLLSLHSHAVQFKFAPGQPNLGEAHQIPEPLTLLVRYLRFGGRKFMYKLLNPSGYRQRFRYDDPQFYFEALVRFLANDFAQDFPSTFRCLVEIRNKAALWQGVMPNLNAFEYSQAQPRYWQESPLEFTQLDTLYKLIVRRPYRRSAVAKDLSDDIYRKLAAAIATQEPIKFSVPFGGYKHPDAPASPKPNLAETFWLEYLREYAAPLAELHTAGVEFTLTYTSGVIENINGISQADQQAYLEELEALCDQLSCDKIRIGLFDIAQLIGGTEQARKQMFKTYETFIQTGRVANDEALKSAQRNLQSSRPAEHAALLCEAMESLPARRNFNKYSEHIQISNKKDALCLHLGSCQTSVVQPWVGVGVYDEKGRRRILSVRQWRESQLSGIPNSTCIPK